MFQRVLIEFVVEVPSMDVAGDVETRVGSEHQARLVDVLKGVTGYQPLQAPGRVGIYVGSEPVTWNPAEDDWIGPDDDGDDGDEPDDDE
jgi:hypothetical protein